MNVGNIAYSKEFTSQTKEKEGWVITKKGRKILTLKEKDARYILYANIKEI